MPRLRLSGLGYVAVLLAVGACQAGGKPPASEVVPNATAIATTAAAPQATPRNELYTCSGRTQTWDGSSAIDLTGTWAGDDQGVYYLRQIGNEIWWLGMSGRGESFRNRGTEWTNVYLGTLSGDTITGAYADVPQGKILDRGPVVLKLTRSSIGGILLVRTDPLLDTGFGGTKFAPCQLG
jgi:hypothetical protein